MDRAAKAALGSVAIGLLVLGLKYVAYRLTGSIALYSDALESIVNVVAAAAALLALWISAKPADANHPYGHHKAEYFSAVLEGVLIVLAALSILRESYHGYMAPRPLEAPLPGLAVNAVASAINGLWSWFLISRGRRWCSPALVADGHHLLADVVTSAGVLVGVGLVAVTGWLVLDPLLAALVAVNILWSGWRMVRESVGGLMDEAASPEVLARIKALISEYADGALEAHDLRTRHAGRTTFIDFHLVVPADMRVAEAHEICDRVETALKQDVEGAVVIIHVEPEEKAKHKGVLVL
ncbi:cation diffusion facilitator family transporter [Benzoatithermus flavus]|uniref:Cation diffusion facilitator family transporter n=1 Tax=Benzoatithermus flavus TaxID=3108223 RepID=A0ABU8XSM5_9PROT